MSRVTACNHRLQASGYNGNMFKLPLPIWLAKDPSGQPIRCCHLMNDSAPDSVVVLQLAFIFWQDLRWSCREAANLPAVG